MIENKSLWIEYKKSGSLEIRERIILQYIPLVKYVVGKMIGKLPKNIEYEDLVEYGIIGLLDAIEKYDITKEINFKTYSITRIRGSIYDELRVQDWVPRSVRKMAKDIEKAYVFLEVKNGEIPKDSEIADYLGITEKELNIVFSKVNMGNISSLDDVIYNSGESPTFLSETVEDKKSDGAQKNIEKKELKAALIERLKEITEKERLVITLYYYEDLTLREIGEILEVSESRVSQIHSKAIIKLRSKLIAKFGEYKGII
ncbi:FliA/WhiG family RNA polymerase sigma factor [Haliovirga abyssi]|uniref:RNA polymerase sigma factor n=1 Tax=Haliovirga abyssi TaxID=2996794 RepID=A0AAU9DCV5_9FUSO|nr:FliA/WhiG family RNA polymerase sigma factor [Haliovirga abyssi]BDU50132.1 RNA polymerase sigma factor WhiG [Haliovirga abyssi]